MYELKKVTPSVANVSTERPLTKIERDNQNIRLIQKYLSLLLGVDVGRDYARERYEQDGPNILREMNMNRKPVKDEDRKPFWPEVHHSDEYYAMMLGSSDGYTTVAVSSGSRGAHY